MKQVRNGCLAALLALTPLGVSHAGPLLQSPAPLDSWIESALGENASLAQSRQAINAVQASADAAGVWDDPVVKYGLAPETLEGPNTVGHRFEVAQRIPWPDQLQASEDAAAADIRVARAETDWQERQVIAVVKEAYANWWYADRAVELHHETRELVLQLLEITEHRLAFGEAPHSQLLRLRTELDALDSQLVGLEAERTKLGASLIPLLGEQPELQQEVPLPLPSQSVIARINTDNGQHPLIQSAIAREQAAKAKLQEKETNRRPSLTASAGYNSLWADESKRWVIGIGVQVPLTGRRQDSAVRNAKAHLARQQWHTVQIQREWQATVSQITEDIRSGYAKLEILDNRQLPNQQAHWQAMVDEVASGRGNIEASINSARQVTSLKLERAQLKRRLFAALGVLESWLPSQNVITKQGGY